MVISMAIMGSFTGSITHNGVTQQYDQTGEAQKLSLVQPVRVKTTKTSSGWRPPTPRYALTWLQRKGSCSMFIDYNRPGNVYTGLGSGANLGEFPYLWDVKPVVPSREIDLMINRLLGKISDNQAGMAENLATRSQVAGLMTDTVHSVVRATKASMRIHPKGWASILSSRFLKEGGWHHVPDFFLEYVYGIRPLMSDAKGAFDMLKRRDADALSERVTFKTGAKGGSDSITPYYGNQTMGPFTIMESYRVVDSWRAFVRVDYAVDNPALRDLQKLGVVNPVELAWNLLPYSFVADWFLPIGSYLQGWTADLGLRFIGGSITTVNERQCTTAGSYLDPSQFGSAIVHSGLIKFKEFNRTVLHDTPAPRMPHWKNPFSALHFAEAMSLLVGLFKK